MDTEKKTTAKKKTTTKKTEPTKAKATTTKKKAEPSVKDSVASEKKDTGKMYNVSVRTKLRVRSGAGTAYPIIGLLPNGYIVNVYDEQDGWAKVDEYKEQWVSMDYLRDI